MPSSNGNGSVAVRPEREPGTRTPLPRERQSLTHKFCCTGDTLVAVADGRNAVPLERLALESESVAVYAAEPYVVKRASGIRSVCYRTVVSTMRAPRLTRRQAEVVKVAFDDGSSLRCTPDHQLMLADGAFKRADELTEGVSMARFDSEIAPYGNGKTPRRRIWLGLGGGHKKNGTEWRWQHRWIGKRLFGDWAGSGRALHHVNENPLDDRYENLELKDRGLHASEHKRGARNPSKPTCLCGECKKCRDRESMRRHRARKHAANHKVVNVSSAGKADVYCGDVDAVHNFAVITSIQGGDAMSGRLSGVISHNCIGDHEGYVIVGFYPDGDVGEVFFEGFGKDGSFIQCIMGCWGKAMSNSLQYGQPLSKVITNYLDMHFDPCGATSNPEVPHARSIPDYVARWLALRFLSEEEREFHGINVV